MERELDEMGRNDPMSDHPDLHTKAKEEILNAYLNGATDLYLSNLQLRKLPPCIGQLTQVTTLIFMGNNLGALSEAQLSAMFSEIAKLPKLTVLHLPLNKLTTLPESFGQLTQLTKLHLWNNQLTTLPENFGQLTQLTTLNLFHNNLKTLPIGLKTFWETRRFPDSDGEVRTLQEQYGQVQYIKPSVLTKEEGSTQLPAEKTEAQQQIPDHIREVLISSIESMQPNQRFAVIQNNEQAIAQATFPANLTNTENGQTFFFGLQKAMMYLYAKHMSNAAGVAQVDTPMLAQVSGFILDQVPMLKGISTIINKLSTEHTAAKSGNQANAFLQLFSSDLEYSQTMSHVAHGLTMALDAELANPKVRRSWTKTLEESYTHLMENLKLKAEDPFKGNTVLVFTGKTAALVAKVLIKNPPQHLDRTASDYTHRLAEDLVNKVLQRQGASSSSTAATSSQQRPVAQTSPLPSQEEHKHRELIAQLEAVKAENEKLQTQFTEDVKNVQSELQALKDSHSSQEQVNALAQSIAKIQTDTEERRSSVDKKMRELDQTTQALRTQKQEMEQKIRELESELNHNNARSDLLDRTQQLAQRNTQQQVVTHTVGNSSTSTTQNQPAVDLRFQQEVQLICRTFSEHIDTLDQGMRAVLVFIEQTEDRFAHVQDFIQNAKGTISRHLHTHSVKIQQQAEALDQLQKDTTQKIGETNHAVDALHATVQSNDEKQTGEINTLKEENAGLKNKQQETEKALMEAKKIDLALKTTILDPKRLEAIATQYFQGLGLCFEHKEKLYVHYKHPSKFRKQVIGKLTNMDKITVSGLVKICLDKKPTNWAPKPLIKAMLDHLLRPEDISTASLTAEGNKQRLYEVVRNTAPQ